MRLAHDSTQPRNSSGVPVLVTVRARNTGLVAAGCANLSRIARSVALFPALFGPTTRTISFGKNAKLDPSVNSSVAILMLGGIGVVTDTYTLRANARVERRHASATR
jgi:hypothetical protein